MHMARLVSRVDFANARQLINNQQRALRSATGVFVGIVAAGRHVVYHLETLLSGDLRPAVQFPIPESSFSYSGAVTADLANAVFSISGGQTAVQAVDPTGTVRWQWRHEFSEGASLVTPDGRHVWAVVAAWDKKNSNWTPEWVVLDATDGRLLDRTPLPQRPDESDLLAHPDGRHVALCDVGPDRSAVFWGSFDPAGAGLQVWQFPSDDETIAGIDPTGQLIAMTNLDGKHLTLREFPHGAVLLTVPATEISDLPNHNEANIDGRRQRRWYQYAGFLDQTTLLASSGATAQMTGMADAHWLITVPVEQAGGYAHDTRGGTPCSPVSYPPPARQNPPPHLWALGDATWLTADANTLYRWTLS